MCDRLMLITAVVCPAVVVWVLSTKPGSVVFKVNDDTWTLSPVAAGEKEGEAEADEDEADENEVDEDAGEAGRDIVDKD